MGDKVHRLQQIKIGTAETPAGTVVALFTNEHIYHWMAVEIPYIVEALRQHGRGYAPPAACGMVSSLPDGRVLLTDVADRASDDDPAAVAFIAERRRWSYGMRRREAMRTADKLERVYRQLETEVGEIAMSEKEGTLRMQPSGQWAIQAPGHEPVPIVAGEIFLLEVQGERRMMRVRMERKEGRWNAVLYTGRAARRVELRDGLRAGFYDQRERFAQPLSD